MQTLALTVLLAIPAILWVAGSAPHWSGELKSNLAATSAHGDISDPGPTSNSRKGSADVIIDLQTVVSVFDDDAGIYNPLVWVICVLLLVMVGWVAFLGGSPTASAAWYALAAIAALSMLGSYHRPYDAKLLLLAVPGCAALWIQGGRIGKIGLFLTTTAIVATSDIPLAILSLLTHKLDVAAMSAPEKVLTIALTRPAPLALLLVVLLYIFAGRSKLTETEIPARVNSEAACQ
jgi:hypothetical protein